MKLPIKFKCKEIFICPKTQKNVLIMVLSQEISGVYSSKKESSTRKTTWNLGYIGMVKGSPRMITEYQA